MIKQLRKRHLQAWTLLSVLLPAGILVAVLAVKKPVDTELLQPMTSTALPIILQSIGKENYTVNLRTNNDTSFTQLEWINKFSLTAPSALIYQLTEQLPNELDNNKLIGRIDTRGTFHFALKNELTGNDRFILYDIIHRKIIDSINFKP